ncbi:helicase [Photobacterium frigidiphilum]|uniref:Helicase n=1 Tax=Photobacterium frigidiphilum TaxID=264736 RepID=A0A2T3JA63_9GAMM|nr:DEAD/DEAH box helicase family protein [Photobacterium frigidiphilum]PSU45732.1 helicase [Photobacterium frigidiphilum]
MTDAVMLNTEALQDDTDAVSDKNMIALSDFVNDFGDSLLARVEQAHPARYQTPDFERDMVMHSLKRPPFDAQAEAVQAVSALLIDDNAPAAIINAEMGTGKTMMAIAATAVMYAERKANRILVLSPPHLVYKWRREIMDTVDNARVWVLNGPDTLMSLLKIREMAVPHEGPEYFILGRVRMRMGYHWKPAFKVKRVRSIINGDEQVPIYGLTRQVVCPDCYSDINDEEGYPYTPANFPKETQVKCGSCHTPLWTLYRKRHDGSLSGTVKRALMSLPTIGKVTAERLVTTFGEADMVQALTDNIYELVNLLDKDGEFVFNDRQSERIERKLAKTQFAFGQGDYQASEFIKRYLPNGFFDLMVIDEAHEYKNGGSAQGQAMQVLASCCKQTLLLTGTLMGGYAEDLFYLLWRCMPNIMMADGYTYHNGRLGSAAMAFSQEHGIIKEIMKVSDEENHKTAKGKNIRVSQTRAPGFGPLGVARYVLPYTVFLKLNDIGDGILPAYDEYFEGVDMTEAMSEHYASMEVALVERLRKALVCGDTTLLGVVMNVLLAWPDCCFRPENVVHPRSRETLAFVPSLFDEDTLTPKETKLVAMVKANKAKGRRTLVYTAYTGKRDTASRLKNLMQQHGIKVAVMRSSVKTEDREDWILEQVDRGVDTIVCNPELVKTGLDLLEFPSIIFMQTGYNVYTLMQASRRSWRIGQQDDVDVTFLGYNNTAQMACLELMAKKIAVTQSTSGDMPDNGLDALNSDGDSVEVALAKTLLAA